MNALKCAHAGISTLQNLETEDTKSTQDHHIRESIPHIEARNYGSNGNDPFEGLNCDDYVQKLLTTHNHSCHTHTTLNSM